jgi:hypothetical protein
VVNFLLLRHSGLEGRFSNAMAHYPSAGNDAIGTFRSAARPSLGGWVLMTLL